MGGFRGTDRGEISGLDKIKNINVFANFEF